MADRQRHPISGPSNPSSTTSASISQPIPSALANARIIEDIGKVCYPEGIKPPSSKLNQNASSGKFRYDRDFLMQFMKVCKEKPDDMTSLDALGLKSSGEQGRFAGWRGRRHLTDGTRGSPIQGVPDRSGRGSKHNDSKVEQPSSGMHNWISAEPNLHDSWSTQRRPATQDPNSPEFIDRKVKALLNKLTMKSFDSISEQILEWANRSVNEVDGRTLIQVIRLVFENVTDEATWSEMYARLCRFLMERISRDVRDEGIKNADGKPITGGNLFHKYLINRCQDDFERVWSAREAEMLAAASKAEDDKAGTGEKTLHLDKYYAPQKAKRRSLGLIKFFGELFKLQMLTERIMYECIEKLLSKVEGPEDEEIESLCKLLATIGQALDTRKARNHMGIYFGLIQELANSGQFSFRIQYMLIDIIELRARKWVSRTRVTAATTIVGLHQKSKRSALAGARIIEDIGKVCYPEGIKPPRSELNLNASSGKFRYDRDFLMQFMKVCKERPDDMTSLDALGLEPLEEQEIFARRRRPRPLTDSTRGPPIQGVPVRGEALQRPRTGRGSKRKDSKVGKLSSSGSLPTSSVNVPRDFS